jgi:hypothetical protein
MPIAPPTAEQEYERALEHTRKLVGTQFAEARKIYAHQFGDDAKPTPAELIAIATLFANNYLARNPND